jgi:YlmC/YmxH family sporulation protein
MERLSTCDLREKEVINLCDGVRLGCPSDFEFNICDGRITAIVISRSGGFLGLGHCNDLVIPWSRIECIGEDAILVKLSASECCEPTTKKKKKTYY